MAPHDTTATTEQRTTARAAREARAQARAMSAAASMRAASDDTAGQAKVIEEISAGRSSLTPLRWIPLDSISDSMRQTRLAAPTEIDALARSIAATGLLQYPSVRRTSDPVRFEMIAGHRRIAALRIIADQGEVAIRDNPLLRDAIRCAGGEWMVAVAVRTSDDLQAFAQTIAENEARLDTSAWEKSVAYGAYRDAVRDAGLAAELDDVASALGGNRSTIAPYLRVHARMTAAVVEAAGLTSETVPRALAALSLGTLRKVVAPDDETARGLRLRAALTPTGGPTGRDGGPEDELPPRPQARRAFTTGGYQLNIRVPLDQVRPQQAARYVTELAGVIDQLVRTSSDVLTPGQRDEAIARLSASLATLGAGGST